MVLYIFILIQKQNYLLWKLYLNHTPKSQLHSIPFPYIYPISNFQFPIHYKHYTLYIICSIYVVLSLTKSSKIIKKNHQNFLSQHVLFLNLAVPLRPIRPVRHHLINLHPPLPHLPRYIYYQTICVCWRESVSTYVLGCKNVSKYICE